MLALSHVRTKTRTDGRFRDGDFESLEFFPRDRNSPIRLAVIREGALIGACFSYQTSPSEIMMAISVIRPEFVLHMTYHHQAFAQKALRFRSGEIHAFTEDELYEYFGSPSTRA